MCGICFMCSAVIEDPSNADKPQRTCHCNQAADFSQCTSLLHHRGPDASSICEFGLPGNLAALMQGCVLSLRGDLTPQPLTNSKGNALLWNGEIFGGIEVQENENDTQVLFDLLDSCSCQRSILEVFQKLNGPWAVIFWQAETKTLWFGRDMFGRRSLLWHLPESEEDNFVLTSVALDKKVYKEIPSVGIFCINFSHHKKEENKLSANGFLLPPIFLFPWLDCRWPGTSLQVRRTPSEDLVEFLYPSCPNNGVNFSVSKDSINRWIPTMCEGLKNDVEVLEECASESKSSRKEQNCVVNCNLTSNSELDERKRHELKNPEAVEKLEFEILLGNIWKEQSDLHVLVQQCLQLLQEAVKIRVKKYEQKKVETRHSNGHKTARIGVLFSGGLDSTILAALADRCLPAEEPIDLLNVAFEQVPVVQQPTKKQKKPVRQSKKSSDQGKCRREAYEAAIPDINCPLSEDLVSSPSVISNETPMSTHSSVSSLHTKTTECRKINSFTLGSTETNDHSGFESLPTFDPFYVPDRQTGRLALTELNPLRKWNLVEINVSQAELQSVRQSHISKLIYPLKTVLDDSIGCAVWFAARGKGVVDVGKDSNGHHESQNFQSQAQVLLCGMAADELFAGYSRHRATFNKEGWPGLEKEMQEELWRISARNLGRDDRIIADHGKEARFPYLDENFVELVSKIPLKKRINLLYPRGIGEKLLLRLCAYSLGLVKTACQAKRAIQFGSKIAKLDNKKEKGSDVCDRLL